MLRRLQPGAQIAVVAVSGVPEMERYRAGLKTLSERYAISCAYSNSRTQDALPRGCEPLLDDERGLPFLAGSDEQRAAQINRALNDQRICAIFCVRGGYGSSRLLPRLDGEALRRRPVPIVGFSDATALHVWARYVGVPSVHGPVVTQFVDLPSSDVDALFALLEGSDLPQLVGLEPLRAGIARGPLTGGNLSILAHLCGGPYLKPARDCIVLLEDVGEAPYRIDRLLTQLLVAGYFDGATGIVFADFSQCDAEQGPQRVMTTARQVLIERLSPLGVPMVWGAPIGHGKRNVAVPFGSAAELNADDGHLLFL